MKTAGEFAVRIEEREGQTTATADQILGEIRDYCRATRTAESTFGRRVVNDGKLVSRLRDGARITTGTLVTVRAKHAVPAAGRKAAERRRRGRRCARRLPVFRQPAEISAVRLDLQREDRGHAPDFSRTRQSAADPAGASDL